MRYLVLLLSLISTTALPMGIWARRLATSTLRYRMTAMSNKYPSFAQSTQKQTRTISTTPSMPTTTATGYMGGFLNSLKQTWRNARTRIAAAFTFGGLATYGAYKYKEDLEYRRKFTVSVDTLNNNIDGLLTKSLQDKTFGDQIVDTAQRNILAIDIESLKKIAAQHPEASAIFAQEFAQHIPDEAITTFYESSCLHTIKDQHPIQSTEVSGRLHAIALLNSKPATKEDQQCVQNIAHKLHLNPAHALKVRQYTVGGVSSAMGIIDMQKYSDYMMSPIVDKAKHFIPYIHVIKLENRFDQLSSEV